MVTGLLLLGVIISLCISSDNFFAQSLIGDAVSDDTASDFDLSGNELILCGTAGEEGLSCSELILCGTAGGGGFNVDGVRGSFVSCIAIMGLSRYRRSFKKYCQKIGYPCCVPKQLLP